MPRQLYSSRGLTTVGEKQGTPRTRHRDIYNLYRTTVLYNINSGLQLIRERGVRAASSSLRQLMTESRAAYNVAQEHAQ